MQRMTMCFVGREIEIRKLSVALEKGLNVIVMGHYGIGRTSLVKAVSRKDLNYRRFVFVDFSKTAGETCKKLVAELQPALGARKDLRTLRYKSCRYLLVNIDFPNQQKPVIVLDNIAKLTKQQLLFLRHLILEKRFHFVAIVESFLTKHALFLLRAALYPSEMITLGHLNQQNTCAYFHCLSLKHHMQWTEDQIAFMSKTAGGYPLGMREFAQRKLNADRGDKKQSTGGDSAINRL